MSALASTVLPPIDRAAALSNVSAVIEANPDQLCLSSRSGAGVELPAEVVDALRQIVAAMSAGEAITIAAHSAVLTTQEAADLLGVSRPTLVHLLEDGKIPYTKPGRHRRVLLSALITYQEQSRGKRRELLDAMAREAADDDSYERVNGFVKTR